jgi:hypothetical protein
MSHHRVCGQEPGAPPAAERAALLYSSWVLDAPKLLDLAVLYTPVAPALVTQLVTGLLELQPRYLQVCSGVCVWGVEGWGVGGRCFKSCLGLQQKQLNPLLQCLDTHVPASQGISRATAPEDRGVVAWQVCHPFLIHCISRQQPP